MRKITSKKLKNYGALSAAIMATAAASGQIVFTDIDDVTIDAVTGGNIDIDLNQDGAPDYNLQMSVVANGTSFTISPDATNNTNGAFVGISSFGFEYPSLLAEGDLIDSSSPTTTPGVRGDLNFYGCAYSNSQFCGDVTDGYVGLIFDFAGATHFGWLLLDSSVPASPNGNTGTVTIRSYAFESSPGVAIAAGDDTLSLEDNVIDGFTSFVDANNILQLDARVPLSNINIYSVSGQQVLSRSLSNNTESIDINALSTGVYVARVTVDGTETAIKFVKR